MLSRTVLGLAAVALLSSGAAADERDDRIRDLERKVAELTRQLDEHKARAANGRVDQALDSAPAPGLLAGASAMAARDLPPAVHGKVTAVNTTAGLVQISVGADTGLRKGHVLDVYRLATDVPGKSVYLGQMTILRLEPKAAVGRFAGMARGKAPVVGDEVATALRK
jgi:hypothetical protein